MKQYEAPSIHAEAGSRLRSEAASMKRNIVEDSKNIGRDEEILDRKRKFLHFTQLPIRSLFQSIELNKRREKSNVLENFIIKVPDAWV